MCSVQFLVNMLQIVNCQTEACIQKQQSTCRVLFGEGCPLENTFWKKLNGNTIEWFWWTIFLIAGSKEFLGAYLEPSRYMSSIPHTHEHHFSPHQNVRTTSYVFDLDVLPNLCTLSRWGNFSTNRMMSLRDFLIELLVPHSSLLTHIFHYRGQFAIIQSQLLYITFCTNK